MKKTMLTAVLATMLAASCTKEGAQGPAGPAGPTGATGNANVKTTTITVNSWNVDYLNTYSYVYSSGPMYWAQLDQNTVDNGAIMAYIKDGNDWIAMPYSYDDQDGSQNLNFSVITSYVKFEVSGFTTPIPSTTSYNGLQFRVVAIPPARLNQHKGKGLKKMTYQEIKQEFNLPD